MKKIQLFAFSMLMLFVIGCGQKADVKSLLSNKESQDEIMSSIVNDHELMTAFMEKMMSSKHAKMMMQGNKDMMGLMMKDGGMMSMMKDNPEMMHNMMSGIMKDGKMMGHMMQMMNQEGMMSDEAMQSWMKMMADKGMDMGDMMMNDGNHDSHHSKQ